MHYDYNVASGLVTMVLKIYKKKIQNNIEFQIKKIQHKSECSSKIYKKNIDTINV